MFDIDIVAVDSEDTPFIIECKWDLVGKGALRQLSSYTRELQRRWDLFEKRVGEIRQRPVQIKRREPIRVVILEEDVVTTTRHTKFVREGRYAAEVEVDLIEEDDGWSPYLSLDDARKLDEVREALRRGDVEAASRRGRVFSLTPISVQ